MNQLEQKAITTLEAAEMVEKPHNDLLKDIRRYMEQLGESNIAQSEFFTESTYQNSQNKTQPCYLVTKKKHPHLYHFGEMQRIAVTLKFTDEEKVMCL